MILKLDGAGDCETKYVIYPNQFNNSQSRLNVSKVKNFESCPSSDFYIQGLFAGLPNNPTEKVSVSLMKTLFDIINMFTLIFFKYILLSTE